MSVCKPENTVSDSCDYDTVRPFDATIVTTKVDNDFPFYGLIAGPGIAISQTPTNVVVQRDLAYVVPGISMSLGNGSLTFNQINTYPQLVVNRPGQYNDGLYANGVITPFISGSTYISVSISYIARNFMFFIEDQNGVVYMRGENNYFVNDTIIDTLHSSRSMDIPPGTRLRLRISSLTSGTVLLDQSYITVSYF